MTKDYQSLDLDGRQPSRPLSFRLVDTSMRPFIILFLLSSLLYATAQPTWIPSDRRLVEISFAEDDKPPTQRLHTVVTLWISETNWGVARDIYNFSLRGEFHPASETHKKATESLKLLQALDEPKVLPESPNQIVTVRCADGDKWAVKRFPIDNVPAEVHQILTIMGFQDKQFSRLTFIKKGA